MLDKRGIIVATQSVRCLLTDTKDENSLAKNSKRRSHNPLVINIVLVACRKKYGGISAARNNFQQPYVHKQGSETMELETKYRNAK